METPRILTERDAAAYQAIRAEMLLDSPWAFLGSPGDDAAGSRERLVERMQDPEQVLLGLDDPAGSGLASVAGVVRSPRLKMRHSAMIFGVYTTPARRGQGLGRRVMRAAIETAWGWSGVQRLGISCSERSRAAAALYRELGFEEWGVEPKVMRVGDALVDEIHLVMLREKS